MRSCEFCGKDISAMHGAARYCSKRHWAAHKRGADPQILSDKRKIATETAKWPAWLKKAGPPLSGIAFHCASVSDRDRDRSFLLETEERNRRAILAAGIPDVSL